MPQMPSHNQIGFDISGNVCAIMCSKHTSFSLIFNYIKDSETVYTPGELGFHFLSSTLETQCNVDQWNLAGCIAKLAENEINLEVPK